MVTLSRAALADQGIGASEVPVLAEVSPYTTPVELWLRKLGRAGSDDSPSMRAGRELERALLKLGAGILEQPLRHNQRTYLHPDWPAVPLYATPDGFDPHHELAAEVKLVGHRFSDWAHGVPDYVGWQVQAQLAVLPKVQLVLVIALIAGEPRAYRVQRDPAVIERLPELVTRWWRDYVLADVAPPALNPADEWVRLRAQLQPARPRLERLATTDEQRQGGELLALIRQREVIEQQIDARRRELAQASAEGSDIAGVGWVARWSERRTTNWRGVVAQARIPQSLVDLHTTANPTFSVRRTGTADPDPEAEP